MLRLFEIRLIERVHGLQARVHMGLQARARMGLQARVHRAAADLEKLPRLFKELPSFLEKLSALAGPGLLERGERGERGGAAWSSLLGRRKLPPLEAGEGDAGDSGGVELSVADDLAPLPLRCSNDLRPSCTGGDEGGGGDGGGDGGCGCVAGGCVGGGCGDSSCGNEDGDGEGGE